MPEAAAPILVKRYPADRLYDVTRGRYVTLDQLRDWRARFRPALAIGAILRFNPRPLRGGGDGGRA